MSVPLTQSTPGASQTIFEVRVNHRLKSFKEAVNRPSWVQLA